MVTPRRRRGRRASALRARPAATTEVVGVVLEIGQLYDRVRLLLDSKRESFTTLGRTLGVTRTRVGTLLLSGRISERTLVRLEAVLGVSRSWWSEPLQERPAARSRAWEVVQEAVRAAAAVSPATAPASRRSRVSVRANKSRRVL